LTLESPLFKRGCEATFSVHLLGSESADKAEQQDLAAIA
jgi:hypothetical protein